MAKKSKEKRVLLFIVEGSNDEAALGMPLENLQKSFSPDSLIRLGVTHGDITSNRRVKNIAHKVTECVKEYQIKYSLQKRDICKVVLLLDMDGAYIPNDAIVRSVKYDKALYCESTILHMNPKVLQETHVFKQKHVNSLIELKHIWVDIPFSVYFVSCNLDHVISGNANLTNREKSVAADDFSLKYGEAADGFLAFFHNPDLVLAETFKESWDAIRVGLCSLQRHSNMNVFLSFITRNTNA